MGNKTSEIYFNTFGSDYSTNFWNSLEILVECNRLILPKCKMVGCLLLNEENEKAF